MGGALINGEEDVLDSLVEQEQVCDRCRLQAKEDI